MEKQQTVIVERSGTSDEVTVKTQKWYTNILVRAARTFLQVFLALMAGIAVVPAVLPPEMRGFVLLPILQQAEVAAQLALLSAVFSLLQNIAELLARLDVNNPEIRG